MEQSTSTQEVVEENSEMNARSQAAITSADEALELHRKLNEFYKANGPVKRKKTAPVLRAVGNVDELSKNLKIQQSPVDWTDLPNGSLFCLEVGGTLLYAKVNKSRALCLNTSKFVNTSGGSCHRIFIS